MTKRALDLAKLIFEAEPDAALGDPDAEGYCHSVERVTLALAKINGAILATTLVRHGEDALGDAVQRIVETVELQARRTASMMVVLEDGAGDPPTDTIN